LKKEEIDDSTSTKEKLVEYMVVLYRFPEMCTVILQIHEKEVRVDKATAHYLPTKTFPKEFPSISSFVAKLKEAQPKLFPLRWLFFSPEKM